MRSDDQTMSVAEAILYKVWIEDQFEATGIPEAQNLEWLTPEFDEAHRQWRIVQVGSGRDLIAEWRQAFLEGRT